MCAYSSSIASILASLFPYTLELLTSNYLT
uniref:Uncharacterized protein n=1 Tax=Podoviridae sp. ct8Lf7 TaxID=2827723 RepID=A0A8S5S0W4_9CAUD|nr:MAG TPA: hypothetical protein [Podoviridae sp. ct8Lf7]